MLGEADKIMKMLDDMYETNPEEYQAFIKKTLEEGKSEMNIPEFKFSIHGQDTLSKRKVLINVCAFPPIPAPKSDEDPISVFGGNAVEEEEKRMTIEYLGINPKVLDEIGNDKSLKKMLIKLAIDYYNDNRKYKLSYECGLSEKQVGNNLALQRAFSKQPSSPFPQNPTSFPQTDIKLPHQLNEEPDSLTTLTPNSGLKSGLISEINSSNTSKIEFTCEEVTDPKHCLKIKAKIDFVSSLKDIDLEIVEDELAITTDSYSVSRFRIPDFQRINENSIKAKFSKSSKVLTVTVNFK